MACGRAVADWDIYQSRGDFMPRTQYTSLVNRLTAAGCHVTSTLVSGSGHSFAYWPAVAPSIKAFLQ